MGKAQAPARKAAAKSRAGAQSAKATASQTKKVSIPTPSFDVHSLRRELSEAVDDEARLAALHRWSDRRDAGQLFEVLVPYMGTPPTPITLKALEIVREVLCDEPEYARNLAAAGGIEALIHLMIERKRSGTPIPPLDAILSVVEETNVHDWYETTRNLDLRFESYQVNTFEGILAAWVERERERELEDLQHRLQEEREARALLKKDYDSLQQKVDSLCALALAGGVDPSAVRVIRDRPL